MGWERWARGSLVLPAWATDALPPSSAGESDAKTLRFKRERARASEKLSKQLRWTPPRNSFHLPLQGPRGGTAFEGMPSPKTVLSTWEDKGNASS